MLQSLPRGEQPAMLSRRCGLRRLAGDQWEGGSSGTMNNGDILANGSSQPRQCTMGHSGARPNPEWEEEIQFVIVIILGENPATELTQ